ARSSASSACHRPPGRRPRRTVLSSASSLAAQARVEPGQVAVQQENVHRAPAEVGKPEEPERRAVHQRPPERNGDEAPGERERDERADKVEVSVADHENRAEEDGGRVERERRCFQPAHRGCAHARGGAVATNEARAASRSYQPASFGCPARQRKSGLRSSSPSATPSVIWAMLSGPRMYAWPISFSQSPTMRRARSVSWRITPGERSSTGRASSRFQTESPSTRLLASASRRRASRPALPEGSSNAGRPSRQSR